MRLLLLIGIVLITSSAFGSRIHYAAHGGDFATVKEIVSKDRKAVSDLDSFQRTPLHYAAWQGHYEICKYLLDNGAPLEARQHDGATPIFYAILGHHPEISTLLLDRGAKINAQDEYGHTPIFHLGNLPMLELARHRGAKLDIADIYGVTPLHNHAKHKNYDIVRFLLKHGANPNGKQSYKEHGEYASSPITDVAQGGDTMIVGLLLKAGATIETADRIGRSPLGWAFVSDSTMFHFLVRHGAKFTRSNRNGVSLLHSIARNDMEYYAKPAFVTRELLLSLLKSTNDVRAVNRAGQTPLHSAAMSGNFELAQMLIEHGADVNARDTLNATPLHYASGNSRRLYPRNTLFCGFGADEEARKFNRTQPGRIAIALYLLSHGADPNLLDYEHSTPLHWYKNTGCDTILTFALAKNARVDNVNDAGENILHSFVHGTAEPNNILRLVSLGANVNQQDTYGWTPLINSIGRGPLEIVKALVAAGADVNLATNHGYTPLECAKSWKRQDIVDFLIQSGAKQ